MEVKLHKRNYNIEPGVGWGFTNLRPTGAEVLRLCLKNKPKNQIKKDKGMAQLVEHSDSMEGTGTEAFFSFCTAVKYLKIISRTCKMTHVSDQENYSKDSNQFKFHKLHF
jgi:hypothetical protein